MSEENETVALSLAKDIIDNLSSFGFEGGPETLVMGLGISNGMPGLYLHEIIGRYQERAVRGHITEAEGIDVALHNVRYMLAASAFMLAKLAEAHTLMSIELDTLIKTMPSKKQALLLLDREAVILTEEAADDAHDAVKCLMNPDVKSTVVRH